jgi:hypothetical protein
MASLSDFPWTKNEDGRFQTVTAWKMIPAVNVMAVGKKYRVEMEDKRLYEGVFRGYKYTKQKHDSVQVEVFLELETHLGKVSLADLRVQSVRTV